MKDQFIIPILIICVILFILVICNMKNKKNYEIFDKDGDLNEILRKMWKLNNALARNEMLFEEDIIFYNKHLSWVKKYYKNNSNYWSSMIEIDETLT